MKITVFYRSNELSSIIVSTTMNKLKSCHFHGLEIDWINLSKVRYQRYFDKKKEIDSLPNKVYVFDESDIEKFVYDNYIQISLKNIGKHDNDYYHPDDLYYFYNRNIWGLEKEYTKEYDLYNEIIRNYKNAVLGTINKLLYGETSNINSKSSKYNTVISYIKDKLDWNNNWIEKYKSNIQKIEEENIKINELLNNTKE